MYWLCILYRDVVKAKASDGASLVIRSTLASLVAARAMTTRCSTTRMETIVAAPGQAQTGCPLLTDISSITVNTTMPLPTKGMITIEMITTVTMATTEMTITEIVTIALVAGMPLTITVDTTDKCSLLAAWYPTHCLNMQFAKCYIA